MLETFLILTLIEIVIIAFLVVFAARRVRRGSPKSLVVPGVVMGLIVLGSFRVMYTAGVGLIFAPLSMIFRPDFLF
ncbi:MAG: hypothetical protein UY70_C0031G0021 [Candidatus Kaiserbacteria bacterium GW2011_GWB1_52_6]|uniref:Uncharacterized protein n=1 Tax=Candidatus Kaiserbacteria bacterium GW2011_GWB1_52_6 TaxID=1618674 RepID=A0A0G1X5J7_9BACT|nr:MAG: hypothetical protein UY70_C0031G0021 [Candidatus Kaiserbacteria bacterium GW2011_GWB1_52_6]